MKLHFAFNSLLIICSLFVGSARADDIAGSKDNALLERYPRSTIVRYEQISDREVWLLTSAIRNVNGSHQAKTATLLIGDVENISYKLSRAHTAKEVFESYQEQIIALGGKSVYQCKGRSCGHSADWANRVFFYSQLYGPDRGQFYALFKMPSLAGEERFIALYTVTRGNGTSYAHLQFVDGDLEEEGIRWSAR